MNKEEVNILEKETAKLFNKYSFIVPRRILPNIIFDWMTPMDCFKIRVRTLLSESRMDRNFKVSDEGKIITEQGEEPIYLLNNKENLLATQIKKRLLNEGIDLDKF